MDKADVAIVIATLAAAFSAWQGYSAHVIKRIEQKRDRRKPPTFETYTAPSTDYPGWHSVEIVARNHDLVSVTLTHVRYRGTNPQLLPAAAQWQDRDPKAALNTILFLSQSSSRRESPAKAQSLPLREAAPEIAVYKRLEPPHQHVPTLRRSKDRSTARLELFAHGDIDATLFDVGWEWADGQKR